MTYFPQKLRDVCPLKQAWKNTYRITWLPCNLYRALTVHQPNPWALHRDDLQKDCKLELPTETKKWTLILFSKISPLFIACPILDDSDSFQPWTGHELTVKFWGWDEQIQKKCTMWIKCSTSAKPPKHPAPPPPSTLFSNKLFYSYTIRVQRKGKYSKTSTNLRPKQIGASCSLTLMPLIYVTRSMCLHKAYHLFTYM